MLWDADSRLATIRFGGDAPLTQKDATVLLGALEGWIGTQKAPFAVLADARGVKSVDPEYRAMWSNFFREHDDHVYLAVFNIRPPVRIVVEMFRIATGMRMRAFADEGGARSWLREMGIAA